MHQVEQKKKLYHLCSRIWTQAASIVTGISTLKEDPGNMHWQQKWARGTGCRKLLGTSPKHPHREEKESMFWTKTR